MIVQPNNFGQPWFPLFTSGPDLPVNPNKGHIHVTAETYRFGEVVYSQNEPSDHTKLWCKTTVSNDYAILGQLWWGGTADDTDFSRIEFGCSGVYKWDGEQWGEVEASIWTGSAWQTVGGNKGYTIVYGLYTSPGKPAAIPGIISADCYIHPADKTVNFLYYLTGPSVHTHTRGDYGYEKVTGSRNSDTIRSSSPCVRIYNGGATWQIDGTSTVTNRPTKSRWNGVAWGEEGTVAPTLQFQWGCSEEKPTALSTPGYWVKHKIPDYFIMSSENEKPNPNEVYIKYSSGRRLTWGNLIKAGIFGVAQVIFYDENKVKTVGVKGVDWDFWDGTKWTGG